jgi:hypothetical protein
MSDQGCAVGRQRGGANNMFIGSIHRVRVAAPREAVVDIVNSTASKRKSGSTFPTTTAIACGPSASIWDRLVNDGRCMASG